MRKIFKEIMISNRNIYVIKEDGIYFFLDKETDMEYGASSSYSEGKAQARETLKKSLSKYTLED